MRSTGRSPSTERVSIRRSEPLTARSDYTLIAGGREKQSVRTAPLPRGERGVWGEAPRLTLKIDVTLIFKLKI